MSCPLSFTDTSTTKIYTLSLHDALPILRHRAARGWTSSRRRAGRADRFLPASRRLAMGARSARRRTHAAAQIARSEEHTSELQSRLHLVCRLLPEKKKKSHSANRPVIPK